MKSCTNILASILLILIVSIYLAKDIVENFGQVNNKIENSATPFNTQSLISSETPFEEDLPIVTTKNPFQFINSGCESFTIFTYFLPSELHSSIWQPPRISWIISVFDPIKWGCLKSPLCALVQTFACLGGFWNSFNHKVMQKVTQRNTKAKLEIIQLLRQPHHYALHIDMCKFIQMRE